MKYCSYKHYVLTGHQDTPESWEAYCLAVWRANAEEAGVTFTANMTGFFRRMAEGTFKERFVHPVPAEL